MSDFDRKFHPETLEQQILLLVMKYPGLFHLVSGNNQDHTSECSNIKKMPISGYYLWLKYLKY